RTTCRSPARSPTSQHRTRATRSPRRVHGRRGLTQPAGPSPSPAEGAHVKRQRLILVATAAVLTAVALTLGGVLHDSSSASPAAAAQVAPTSASGQPSPGNTLAVAARLQATLRGNPNDVT